MLYALLRRNATEWRRLLFRCRQRRWVYAKIFSSTYQEKKQSVVITLQSEFCSDIICDNFLPNVEFVNRWPLSFCLFIVFRDPTTGWLDKRIYKTEIFWAVGAAVHFKTTVARISVFSKLWYFLFWFVLKLPKFRKKWDSRNCLLKMHRL